MPRSGSKSSAGPSPSTAAEDSEVEYQSVASRVASVTLESDSLPDTPMHSKKRKRRLVKRPRLPQAMDVDVDQSGLKSLDGSALPRQRMEWEGDVESELSTTDTQSSDGREADDEQSDWPHDLTDTEQSLGHRPSPSSRLTGGTTGFLSSRRLSPVYQRGADPSSSRPPIPIGPPSVRRAIGASRSPSAGGGCSLRLQRRIERFARDPHARELTIDARTAGKERLHSSRNFERLLDSQHLDVVRRYRGMLMLRKRVPPQSS